MPSVSKKQQKFMGIVRAIQKGEADPSDFNKDAQDAAKKMKKSSVKKYAKTKKPLSFSNLLIALKRP